ncbi:5'-methylthioadenosine/adenosylhomocysteine nucleosidase [Clostridium senegalense]|uniref:5'-methylthioadenosine/adenosylhomocysteine nucleosidase n=1 Tax=Clostridium senegalense TaxID=1465809 RepID=UPI001C127252|nr:5'-methylthioadenosine/adenosylhomocysteine nucleosidase [Clostridium senegalense]MBU5225336.1 5'-methylthioadenosine/adenosylhomocysteine nucleosidase [Clostridium senegalense]
MVIGIIGAMDEEVKGLIDEMDIESKKVKAMMEFNKGTLYGKNVVIVRCGIGKVNAAICTQILCDDYYVDKVINVGIAGGIGMEIYPGDIVIGSDLVQHDMDTSAFGDRIGQIPRLDVFDFKCDEKLVKLCKEACNQLKNHKSFVGRIVSGDQFIGNVEKIKWLNSEFNALACEMEGASIAHAAYLNHVPFVVIRSISDNANNGAHIDYEKFKDIAVENSNNILRYMLKSM